MQSNLEVSKLDDVGDLKKFILEKIIGGFTKLGGNPEWAVRASKSYSSRIFARSKGHTE